MKYARPSVRSWWFASLLSAATGCSDTTRGEPDQGLDAAADTGASDGSPALPDAGNAALPDATVMDAAADVQREAGTETKLIDHRGWRRFEAALDPLISHQPSSIDCALTGWFIERGRLEVSTAECNYLLIEHPSLVALPQGAEVLVELWNFDLVAPEPAEAHIALLFGSDLVWETRLAIPQPGNVHQIRFVSPRALAAGEPIRLHLHNHGQNTYLLSSIVTTGQVKVPDSGS